MRDFRRRLGLAVLILIILGLALTGLYFYLKSIEPRVLGAVDQLQDNLQDQLVVPVTDHERVLVTKVIDGDTIELADGRKLRYIGIDTPETRHPTKKVECFGKEAAERNRQLVEGKFVTLEKDISEIDRYGRLLRYVWVDQQLINTQLVAEGYAVSSSYPPDIAKQSEFQTAELQARAENKGLWGHCGALTL